MQLFQTVQEMQEQLKKVHETALQLAAEKEDRQSHINVAIIQEFEFENYPRYMHYMHIITIGTICF